MILFESRNLNKLSQHECDMCRSKNRSQQLYGIRVGKRAQSIRVYGILFREREIEKAKGVPSPCTPVPLSRYVLDMYSICRFI